MFQSIRHGTIVFAVFGFCSVANAQMGNEAPLPEANEKPAEIIPISAFASQLQLTKATLSQTGRHFAVTAYSKGRTLIHIYDTDTRQRIETIDAGEAEDFRWMRWAGDNRLLMSVMMEKETSRFWARFSRLLLFDLEAGELRYIGRDKQGLEGDDVLFIDPKGEYILLSLAENKRKTAEVLRFPLDGSGEDGAVTVQDDKREIDEWFADNKGVVRLGYGSKYSALARIFYRSGPDGEFEKVFEVNPYKQDERSFDNWDILGIYAGSDTGYAITSEDNGRKVLREVDYRSGVAGEVVYAIDGMDVERVRLDPEKGPIGVGYTDDLPRMAWLDPQMKSFQQALEQVLGRGQVTIISNAGTRRMLVHHARAGDPGALYVFNPGEGRLDLFSNVRPEIDFTQLAEGTAHTIKTRDGYDMRVFLTLPKGRAKSGLPLIVVPHGGPYGVRDTLEFDDWVQLLANRGYAVLQPNYRGSSGYGRSFEELGDGQIGRAMQDDLDDARAWAVEQGYADPARVCMVGGSYGGYAAIWSVMRNPELYRCAVSWAGVTDWSRQLIHDSNVVGRRVYKGHKERVRGDDMNLSEVSPLKQAARLTRPLLLAHGKNDRRVLFMQFERLRKALQSENRKVETLVLDEGHNFSEEETSLEFMKSMVDFLARHNPAD